MGMRMKRSARFYVCKKIFTRTLVIPRTWIRKEVVFYSRIQNHKEIGNRIAEQMMMEFSESGHPVFRASIKSIVTRNAQKQMWWKIIDTPLRLKLFRTIISVNQLSIYGAVSNLCEESKNEWKGSHNKIE